MPHCSAPIGGLFRTFLAAMAAPRVAGRHVWLASALLAVGGCARSLPPPPPPPPPPIAAVLVGDEALAVAAAPPPAARQLDIGIGVFANEYPRPTAPELAEEVAVRIRDNEARYLPFALRETLAEAGHWGAVRVLPEADPSMDLTLSGTILHSDGAELVLRLQARDSSGRLWLDETYRDYAAAGDYPDSVRYTAANRFDARAFQDPFQDLHNRVANDLLAAATAHSDQDLGYLRELSRLIYARDLSPASFGHMLAADDGGLLRIVGAPARDDPMMARVDDMRYRHHLFIDRVDQYYQALFEDMRVPYLVWRHYSREQEVDLRAPPDAEELANIRSREDSFLALSQRYNRFRWAKIYEREFATLAAGFTSEVAPAILELNKQVHGLTGTMAEQYGQWRRILRQLFEIETGQPAGGDAALGSR